MHVSSPSEPLSEKGDRCRSTGLGFGAEVSGARDEAVLVADAQLVEHAMEILGPFVETELVRGAAIDQDVQTAATDCF